MSDSYLAGTKKDHPYADDHDRGKNVGAPSKEDAPNMQRREGQTKATNDSADARNGNSPSASKQASAEDRIAGGSCSRSKTESEQEQPLGTANGQQEVRTIDTPPGEPYNDPRVRP